LQELLGGAAKQAESGGMMDNILTMALDKNKDGSYKDDLITMGMNWIKSQLSSKK
jgi:hypothetical protein